MKIFGPEGLREIVETISNSNSYGLLEQPFQIKIVEVAANANFEVVRGITATTLKTPHTKESLALGLKDEDSKLFVYTSDTGFSEDLGPFAKHAALFLLKEHSISSKAASFANGAKSSETPVSEV